MATWQFDLHVSPSAAVKSIEVVRSLLDEGRGWGSSDIDRLLAVANDLLAERRSWSSHLRSWGLEDGHRLDVSFENAQVSTVFVRIDVRDARDFLAQLATVAQREAWLFVAENGELIEPSYAELAKAVAESPAARFIEDPEAFLKSLSAF